MDFFYAITDSPGLPTLFLLSFLASTILPIGSEWLLVILIMQGLSPTNVVITATIGNFLGAYSTYLIGIWGSDFFIRTVLRISDAQLARSRNVYEKYGTWSLLVSWLPVVGDPLCLLAGLFKIGLGRFSLLVFVGKFARYATLAFLTLKSTGE
jgi:membrane protein YqaA with SNARE-associated domain